MVPKDMKLVHPDGAFCLKAADAKGGKVFVNFCSSPEVDNCFGEKAKDKMGKTGMQWKVPYIMPPNCRYDVDAKTQERVTIFDVVFGPETIKRAVKEEPFQNLVVEVALDGVQKNGKLELTKEFKVLKNVTVKSGPIPALSIRLGSPVSNNTLPSTSATTKLTGTSAVVLNKLFYFYCVYFFKNLSVMIFCFLFPLWQRQPLRRPHRPPRMPRRRQPSPRRRRPMRRKRRWKPKRR
jgi:hypothetical protein